MKIVCAERDAPLEAANASNPSSAACASGSPYPTPPPVTPSHALSGAKPPTRSSPPSATTDSTSLMSHRLQIIVGSEHSSPPLKEYPSPPPKVYLPPRIRAGPVDDEPLAPVQHGWQADETTDSQSKRVVSNRNIDTSKIQSLITTPEDASGSRYVPPSTGDKTFIPRSWPRSNYPFKGYVPHKRPNTRRTLRDIIKDAPASWQLQETALQARLKGILAEGEKTLQPAVDGSAEGTATFTSEQKDVHAYRDRTPDATPPIAPGPLSTEAPAEKTMKELAAECTDVFTHTLEAQLSALLQRAAEEKMRLEAKNAELAAELEVIHAKEREEARRAQDNLLFALEQKEELRLLRLRLKEANHNYGLERERHRLMREKAEDAIFALQMALEDAEGDYSDNSASQTVNDDSSSEQSDMTSSRSPSPNDNEDPEDLARRAWAQATLKQEAQRRILDGNSVAAAGGVWLDMMAQARITSMLEDFSPSRFSLEVPLTVNSVPWPVLTNPLELTLDMVNVEAVKAFCANVEKYSSEAVYRERLLTMWRLFRVEGWDLGLVSVIDEELRGYMRDTVIVVCQALASVLRECGWEEEEQEVWDEDIFVGDEQEEIDEVASELEPGDEDETY